MATVLDPFILMPKAYSCEIMKYDTIWNFIFFQFFNFSRRDKEEEDSSQNSIPENQNDLENKIAESMKSKWDSEPVEEDEIPETIPEDPVTVPEITVSVADVRRISEDELLKKREKWRSDSKNQSPR